MDTIILQSFGIFLLSNCLYLCIQPYQRYLHVLYNTPVSLMVQKKIIVSCSYFPSQSIFSETSIWYIYLYSRTPCNQSSITVHQ